MLPKPNTLLKAVHAQLKVSQLQVGTNLEEFGVVDDAVAIHIVPCNHLPKLRLCSSASGRRSVHRFMRGPTARLKIAVRSHFPQLMLCTGETEIQGSSRLEGSMPSSAERRIVSYNPKHAVASHEH